jgi:phosphohistidine phosphatase
VKLYLVRHADAVPETRGLGDENRYLSEPGRRTCLAVGETLRAHGHVPDLILTSPLVRAVQTAELLARALAVDAVEALPAAAPGVPARACADLLLARSPAAVLVVGHEPSIAMLAAHLAGKPWFPPFRKAQVVLIDGGRAELTLDPDTRALHPVTLG